MSLDPFDIYLEKLFNKNKLKFKKNQHKINKCYPKKGGTWEAKPFSGYVQLTTFGNNYNKLCSMKFVPGFIVNEKKKYIDFFWKVKSSHPWYKTIKPYISKLKAIGRKYKFGPLTNPKAMGLNYKTKKKLKNALFFLWLTMFVSITNGIAYDFIQLKNGIKIWGSVKLIKIY